MAATLLFGQDQVALSTSSLQSALVLVLLFFKLRPQNAVVLREPQLPNRWLPGDTINPYSRSPSPNVESSVYNHVRHECDSEGSQME